MDERPDVGFDGFKSMGFHPLLLQVVPACGGKAFRTSIHRANHRKPTRGEAPPCKSIVRNEMEGYGVKMIVSTSQPRSGDSMVEINFDSEYRPRENVKQCGNRFSDERSPYPVLTNVCSIPSDQRYSF